MNTAKMLMIAAACLVAGGMMWAEPETKPAPTAKPAPSTKPVPASVPATQPASQPASAPGALAAAPSTKPAPASAPATQPASQPATAPGAIAAASSTQPANEHPRPSANNKAMIRFQYDGIDFNDLIRLFAQNASKPILGECDVPGKLTFFDSEPYNYSEAFDTINILLAMRGFWLVEDARYFRVVKLASIPNESPILTGVAEMETFRPGEVVTVVLPLKYVDPGTASKAVVRMVSTWGSISPLVKVKGLVVTDSAGSIRRIQQFLKLLDTGSIMEKQIKAVPLRRASARVVTGIINDVFGGASRRKMVYNANTGRYDYEAADPEETITATADDRTNTVVLMGSGEKLTMAEQVIKELDKESEETAADIRIFKLKNVKAEEMAKTLRDIMAEDAPAGGSSGATPSPSGWPWRQPVAGSSAAAVSVVGHTKIVADTAGNRLIVSSPSDTMAAIEKLIKDLDGDAVSSGTARIFRLKSADAQSLAGIITRATTATDPRTGRTMSAIQVSADTRTNSLVVTGPAGDIQMAASLLEELDKDTAVDPREIHVVQLQAGDAKQIAVSLVKLFAKEAVSDRGGHGTSGTSLRVEADAVTNSLLIAATPGDWPVVQRILDQLKASVMPMATASTRRYPLKAAKAEEMAETLRQIYGGSRSGRGGAPVPARTGGPAAVPVVIAAHKDVNCLLVSAAEDDQKAIAELVAALDVPSSEKIDPIRLVKLTSAEAARLAATLKSMQPPPVRGEPVDVLIEAEPLTNSLLIRAPEAKWKTLEEMIGKLDAATKSQVREMRIIVLKHTSAAGLAGMLSELYSGAAQSVAGSMSRGSPRPPGSGSAGAAVVEERIVITPAPGDRALVVDAPKARIDEIAHLVQQLDSKEAPGTVQTRTYDLTTANAIDTAVSLERLFAQQRAGMAAGGGRQPAGSEPQPRFEANAASNQLLVAATASQFEEIDKLVASIQAGTKAAGETRTFRLKYVKASDLVEVLATMLSDEAPSTSSTTRRPGGAGGRAPGSGATAQTASIRVAAVPEANAVVVQGPPTKLALAEKLIAGFDTADVATAGKIIIRTYQMSTSKAADVAVSLAGLFGEGRGSVGRAGTAAGEPQPRFDADAATNQLLVAATASQFAEIDKVIKDLQAGTVLASQTRTFVLKHARASDVADVLAAMLAEGASAARRVPGVRAPGAASSAQESLSRVSFMEGSNTVVVQASPEKLLLAEGLIKTFDVPEAGGKTVVEVVKLSNAQAVSLAEAVTSALAARAARGGAGRPVAGDDQAVTVTAEVNSNSVLVRGPVRDVPEVVEMIRRLDTQGTSSAAQVRIFRLENSSAIDLEKSVSKLFKEIVAQSAQRSSKGGAAMAPPPFSVVADERTNSLVVSTTNAHFAIIESLLASLDKAGPLRDVQYVFLEKANASEVASKLAAMYVDRKGDAKPNIEPDDISNSIAIVAKDMDMKAMEGVIVKLEKASEWGDRPIVRVIPLQKIRASQMADVIQRVYGQMTDVPINVTERLPDQTGTPEDPNGMLLQPAILPIDEDPLLMPSGTGGKGGGRAGPAAAPAPKPISMARPKETQPSSQPATQPTSKPAAKSGAITITVDKTSNSLIVLAKRAELSNIQAIIDQLAVNAQQADAEIRVFRIKEADCASIANTLDTLFNPRMVAIPAAGGRGGGEPPALPEPKINAVPDARTKSLIVRAKPADFELIIPLIAQLDKMATVISEVRVFILKNTDAAEVAENLKDLFQPPQASQPQMQPLPNQPQAQPAQGGRRTGNRARTDMVRQMLEIRGAGGVTQVDPATGISIAANRNTNSVIVSAPADAMKLVEKIIEELDQATAMAQSVRLYPLKHAEVQTTVNALREVFATGAAPSASSAAPGAAAGGARGPRTASRGGSGGVGREAPVIIAGDEAARLVIVSAPSDKQELIEKVIGEIDTAQSAGEIAVKVYRLTNAQAATAAAALSQAMTGAGGGAAGGRGARGGGGDAQLRISADASSNCLIVKAGKEDHARIAALLIEIDAAPADKFPVRTIALQHADAEELAGVLSRMFAGGQAAGAARTPGRRGGGGGMTGVGGASAPVAPSAVTSVAIDADRNARMLLVRADDATFEKVKQLVATLDVAGSASTVREIIALKYARASDLAATLSAAFVSPRAARGGTGEDAIVIVPEPTSNSLIVTASAVGLESVKALLAKLDSEIGGGGKTEFLVLKNAQAAEMAGVLTQISGTRSGAPGPTGATGSRGPRQPARTPTVAAEGVIVTAESSSNAVVLTGPGGDVDKLLAVAKRLDDAAASMGTAVVKLYGLKNAEVPATVAALQEIFAASASSRSTGPAARSPRGAARGPGEDVPVVIVGDEGARKVLVSAPEAKHVLIAKVIEEIDASQQAENVSVRVYRLENAQAPTAAAALSQAMTGSGAAPAAGGRGARGGSAGGSGQFRISADASSNCIVVRASKEDHEKITGLLKEMDIAQAERYPVRTLALKQAEADAVAETLNRLFGTTGGVQPPAAGGSRGARPAQGGKGNVVIEPDRGSRMLLVRADEETFARIEEVVAVLDVPGGGKSVPTVIALKHAQAAAIAPALQAAFAGQRSAKTKPEETVTVIAEPMSNSLLVTADGTNLEKVKSLLSQLDAPMAEGQGLVKVYRLENAQASSVAAALSTAMNAGGGGGGASGAAARGPRTGVAAGGAAVGAAVANFVIAADNTSNSLIVRADKDDHARIGALLKEMDAAPSDKFPVRTIALNSADATEVAAVLGRVFSAGGSPASGSAAGGSAAGRGPRAGGAGVGGVKGSVVIEADRGSRMLLVRCDDETFTKVKELATKLDATNPAGRAARTLLALKHANAEAVSAALNSAFLPPKGARVEPEDLVAVVADPGSNSILVTANVPNLEKVKGLLAQLDTATAGERTELLLLKNAKATDLAKTLTTIAASVKTAGGAGKPGSAKSATLSADASSNALIVTGPREEVDRVMQMALQLDKAAESSISSVEVIALKNGDAYSVAAMVRDLYTQQSNAAKANQQAISALAVTADDRANALVVAASKDMHEMVARWVAQIEEMKPARGTMRLLRLKNVDPLEVERAIQQIYNSPSGGARGPEGAMAPSGATPARRPATAAPAAGGAGAARAAGGGRVQTSVLDAQRSILINASDEDFEAIKALADALDQAAAATRQTVQLFVLKKADNKRVATALSSMYRPVTGRTPRPEDQVVVTALDQTNAIVASGTKEKLAEVAHLIEQLDKEDVAPSLQFKIFPLANTQPTKIMPALQQMLLQIRKLRPDDTVDVQADERTKSVIVTAKSTLFEEVGKIITALDKPAAHASVDVLIIPLKKADAPRMAEVLTEMLRPSKAGQVTPEAMALQEHVRLLKVHGLQENIAELDLTQPIKIATDPAVSRQQGSNALVITSTPNNLKAMQAIVEMLDVMPLADDVRVKVMQLKNADAVSVSAVLKDVFTQGKQLAGNPKGSVAGMAEPKTVSGKGLVNVLNVSADPRTNTLVISGGEESIALAELIARDLDRSEGKIITEVRLFKLKHGDAVKLLPLLQAVFAEGAPVPGMEGLQSQVTRLQTVLKDQEGKETKVPKTRAALVLQADAATNILIVAARSDVMPLLADVIGGMDIPGAGTLGTIRFVPFSFADASSIQSIINSLHTGSNAALLRAEDKPVLTYDSRTNALIISASQKTWDVLEPLIKRLDANTTITSDDVRVIALKSADATALGTALQRVMDSRVSRYTTQGAVIIDTLRMTIVPDPRSNSLIVGGREEGFKQVKALAEQLDGASPALVGQIQFLPLKEANAGAIATSLTSFFTSRYAAAVTPDVTRQKPIIMADVRSNSLLVAANADDTKILKSLLEKLDTKLTDPAVQIQVVPLKKNTAAVVGPMIQQIFTARLASMTAPGATAAPQDRVDVAADALSNSLVISASKENHALIRDLIARVDSEPAAATTFRVFALKNGTATLLQPTLDKLFLARVTRGATKDAVTIIADPHANTLIVGASPADMDVAAGLIEQLDKAKDGSGSAVQAFPLTKADATQVAKTLQELYRSGGATTTPVSITVDERTNTIMVSAGPSDAKRIAELIAQLDRSELTSVTEIRVYSLQNADATELAKILTDTLTTKPKSPTAVSANRQTLLQFVSQTKDGKEMIERALQEGVLITPDVRTNSLIISAPIKSITLLESLVKALDSTSPRAAEIRVFALTNSDCRQMAEVLTQLFRLKSAGTTGGGAAGASGARAINYTLVSTQPALNGAAATLGMADQDSLSVTVDIRTNGLLVGGTTRLVDLAANVIETLDSCPAQERETKVYRLRNAAATNIQTAMRAFLDQEKQRLSSVLGQQAVGSAFQILEREVAIVAEPNSNTLLLSASPRYFETIEAMIHEMDMAPPQVLIQVLLAEVTLDDKTELGVDWNLVHKWDSGKKSVGYGTNFGVSAQTAGFSLAVTAGDLEMFMRALQSQGKLEILSRPQILAADNQRANINVGQRVPFVTNTTVNPQGGIFNTVQYQDVGILLTVTPRINPDGFVRIQVNPEISSLSTSTVDIGQGVKGVVINKRSAVTTVTVQDGHTIVIGGLITTKDEHREDKIPVLGDWPLIGPLFKTTTKTKERSELLIILTPHVLRTPAEADAVSDVQGRRVNMIRRLQREQIEDSLRKYLGKFMDEQEYATDLRPTTQPTTSRAASDEAKALMRVREQMGPTTRPAIRVEYERKDPNQN